MYIENGETFNGSKLSLDMINEEPDICPLCHKHIVANPKYAKEIKDGSIIQVIFKCNNKECNHLFIGTYAYYGGHYTIGNWKLVATAPKKSIPIEKEELIEKLSSMFYPIYEQAIEAEKRKLNHIAGMGLRKALEFIIRDYCIYKKSEKKESILKTKNLGSVIQNFVENPDIKDMAERASWLGNDEVHYSREWKDMDINDLKELIDITIHWITFELKTEERRKK